MKKIISLLIAAMLAFSVAACKEETESGWDPNAPDYSAYTDSFINYAYGSVRDDNYQVDGVIYNLGESFITKEKFQEYKDCGFQVIMPQTAATTLEDMQTVLDLAQEVGLKVLLTDNIVIGWGSQMTAETPLVDPSGKGSFETEEEWEQALKDRMNNYANHPAFYGVILKDEVPTTMLTGGEYGKVYKTIRKLFPNAYIHANMWGISAVDYDHADPTLGGRYPKVPNEFIAEVTGVSIFDKNFDYRVVERLKSLKGDESAKVQGKIIAERYRLYCEAFLDATGADALIGDAYPLYGTVQRYYMAQLQTMAQVAKERNVDFRIVTQSMTLTTRDNISNARILSNEDLHWLNNILLGFGCTNFGYFTYYTHGSESPDVSHEYFVDGAAFMTHFGEKTELYYNMQKIFANNQKFAPTFMQFKYRSSRTFNIYPHIQQNNYSIVVPEGDFVHLKKVNVDNESVLVTELYDEENDNYMYMAMNIVDSQYQGSTVYNTTTLTFSDKFDNAILYANGEFKTVKLKNHRITLGHRPGEATFVIPY